MKNAKPAFVAQGKSWSPTGCEGTVVYQVGDSVTDTVSIYFNIPTRPFSKNEIKVTPASGLAFTLDGFSGAGSTEAVEVTVREAS